MAKYIKHEANRRITLKDTSNFTLTPAQFTLVALTTAPN